MKSPKLYYQEFSVLYQKNFMKTFNIDGVTLTSHLMMSYRKINIASEKIVNYRVTSPSKGHGYQINMIVRERPSILVIIDYLFSSRYSNIFKLLKPVYSYACILTSLYQFDKKLTKHFPANIYTFQVRIVTLR